jgi:NhaP-type Na+/H+ or K+/H+ antiporter
MDAYYVVVALTAAVFVAFGALSQLLERGPLTAPMLCVALGFAASRLVPGELSIAADSRVLAAIGEVALAIVLFTDAAGIDRRALRDEWRLPLRLLAVGLPLTVLAGTVVGAVLLPDLPWTWLGVIAMILAPTDAALGIATLRNEAVPQPVRDALNVESGLNDGLVLPPLLALLAFAAAATASSATREGWVVAAAGELAFGAAIGALFGAIAGRSLDAAWVRGWVEETYARLLTPGLALLAFVVAHALDKNGFVAAYVAGLALAVKSPRLRERLHAFGEADGTQFSLFVFLLFGFAFLPAAIPHWGAQSLAYALASLTVVRMLPVAVALLGTRLPPATVLFVGWSGPRGIASVLYLALVVDRFGFADHERVFAVVVLTVLLSVLLHGMTAAPLASRFGRMATSPARN